MKEPSNTAWLGTLCGLPVVIVLHWQLSPLWIMPILESAYGPIDTRGTAHAINILHGVVLVFSILALCAAAVVRIDYGRWPWIEE